MWYKKTKVAKLTGARSLRAEPGRHLGPVESDVAEVVCGEAVAVECAVVASHRARPSLNRQP